jgi:methenyltetrahydrofolate cyclohydrolase
MGFDEYSVRDFVAELSSKAAVPGGGGASALAGALGAALGGMVGNLTLGKKKYEAVQGDIEIILVKAFALRDDLVSLIQEDALVFEPLSKAYGLPKDSEEARSKREAVLEAALRDACGVPLRIMEKSLEAIALHEELVEKGSRIAVSDVGVGVQLCKAALMGASLNVYINTGLMRDRPYAASTNDKANGLLDSGTRRADLVYAKVEALLKR